MSANFDSALTAAHAAAAGQHYPTGALYVVATPIGNLADISLRALHVLGLCDTLACEDTRHSQTLLRAYGVDKSSAQWLAVHQHNEAEAAEEVIRRLQAGQRIAYVSDAGTPAVSDPGARLAWQVQRAGLRVVPMPGASSVTALLSACGGGGGGASGQSRFQWRGSGGCGLFPDDLASRQAVQRGGGLFAPGPASAQSDDCHQCPCAAYPV